ncbi:hypothetical protein BJ741DRAFT_613676 [Chytriomyces cf. hyalinus JEL632]|nr:hypothetical protein BJ741DRAFT_613676 [Chytriomyces cf. hyalinus JEL632]
MRECWLLEGSALLTCSFNRKQTFTIAQFTDYGFPGFFLDGPPSPVKNFAQCALLFSNTQDQANGFIFNSAATPSTCQKLSFTSIPGNSLYINTPTTGFENLGPFGGKGFTNSMVALQSLQTPSDNSCVAACKAISKCVVAVFSGATKRCDLATMQHTEIGLITGFYTRTKCDAVVAKAKVEPTSGGAVPISRESRPNEPTTEAMPSLRPASSSTSGMQPAMNMTVNGASALDESKLALDKKFPVKAVVIGALTGVVVIFFVAGAVLFYRRQRMMMRVKVDVQGRKRRDSGDGNLFMQMSSRA